MKRTVPYTGSAKINSGVLKKSHLSRSTLGWEDCIKTYTWMGEKVQQDICMGGWEGS